VARSTRFLKATILYLHWLNVQHLEEVQKASGTEIVLYSPEGNPVVSTFKNLSKERLLPQARPDIAKFVGLFDGVTMELPEYEGFFVVPGPENYQRGKSQVRVLAGTIPVLGSQGEPVVYASFALPELAMIQNLRGAILIVLLVFAAFIALAFFGIRRSVDGIVSPITKSIQEIERLIHQISGAYTPIGGMSSGAAKDARGQPLDEVTRLSRAISDLGYAVSRSESMMVALENETNKSQATARLALVGQLATSVAHEINNPLAIMSLTVEEFKRAAKKGEMPPGDLTKILDRLQLPVQRIARTTKNLLSLGAAGKEEKALETTLGSVVAFARDVCAERLEHTGVKIELSEEAREYALTCRIIETGQILIALIHNAIDSIAAAMKKSGDAAKDMPKTIRISATLVGTKHEITVSNSGGSQLLPDSRAAKPTGVNTTIAQSMATRQGGELIFDAASVENTFILQLPQKPEVSYV